MLAFRVQDENGEPIDISGVIEDDTPAFNNIEEVERSVDAEAEADDEDYGDEEYEGDDDFDAYDEDELAGDDDYGYDGEDEEEF